VSPLAEGADRLVAREVLLQPDAMLELALPMQMGAYLAGFTSPESRAEFQALRDEAALVTVMAPRDGDDAYAVVGRYVLARCDVLIAVWDGDDAHGRGGTGEIAKLARDRRIPMFWIRPDGSTVTWKRVEKMDRRAHIDRFNGLSLSNSTMKRRSITLRDEWLYAGRRSGLDDRDLEPYLAWVVPPLARADLLADRYQRWYRHAGSFLFAGSFLAVAVAAYQALFRPDRVWLVWLEALAMVSLLLVLYVAHSLELHSRWLGYRCLAEQFRSALFLALAGMGKVRTEVDPRAAEEQPDWVQRLVDELWVLRPKEPLQPGPVGDFVGIAWLKHQINYNRLSQVRNHRFDLALKRVVTILFAATLLVAIVHAAEISDGGHHWMELASILLPAAAAAVHGIRAQRDYVRNAERASRLHEGLGHVLTRLPSPASAAQVQAAVAEAAQLMRDENREWFGSMRYHDLEIPG
jgi:hypothetical protein